MSQIEIIAEKPLSMVEFKDRLESIKKRDKELSFRAKKTEEYINRFIKIKPNKAIELKKDLMDLKLLGIRESQIVKIIDLMPIDNDSLKLILFQEGSALKQEELSKIIELVKKYV